jgi:hypothetical protein
VRALDADDILPVAIDHLDGRLHFLSFKFCSIAPDPMPAPTTFRKARTRVFWVSMIRFLKSSKLRQPDEPASATVVTPRAA